MTTKPTHTPGDWHLLDGSAPLVLSENGDEIADCSTQTELSLEEKKANARLIAASPKLLEVLKELASKMDDDHWFADQIKDAIAKAEGNWETPDQSDVVESSIGLLDPLSGSPGREDPEWQGD